MAIAQTAQMLVELNLAGNFNSGIGQAEANLSRFGASTSTAFTKFGGALSHAGNQIKNLVTGLGVLGLAGGLFTITGFLERGISKAQSFGDEVRQLTALTGQSAESVSAMAAAMEHFGIEATSATRLTGFLEKNVGLLAARKNGIVDFQKTFGLALLDSNKHLKTANELLLTSADYFNNKHIPATTKAAALAKLYGRSWQELIPFLSAGRAGIQAAEEEAAKLGLTLSKDNVDALAKLKVATRDWGTALGGLQLQIGLVLVPMLTDAAKAATAFVSNHRGDIVAFFKGIVSVGRTAAGVIGQVVGTLGSAWNAIPGPLRDFLLKGLVADRTIKFLFGFSPVEAVGSALLKGLTGSLFSRGTPFNPMWVAQVGGGALAGGVPGVGGAAGAAAAGGLGLVGGGLALLGVAGALLLAAEGIRRIINPTSSGNPLQTRTAAMDAAHLAGQFAPPQSTVGSANVGGDPESRQIASNAAYWSAKTAARTEGVRIAIAAAAQRTATAAELARRIAQRTSDKVGDIRETNRILRAQKLSVTVNVPVRLNVSGTSSYTYSGTMSTRNATTRINS